MTRPPIRRDRTAWLLHGLGPDGQDSIEHAELALDEEFAAFCSERLTEEVLAATLRRQHAGDGVDPRAEAGLRVLHELLGDLARGVLPDDVTLQLLLGAYAAHPDFRARWRDPALLLRPEPATRGTGEPPGRPRR